MDGINRKLSFHSKKSHTITHSVAERAKIAASPKPKSKLVYLILLIVFLFNFLFINFLVFSSSLIPIFNALRNTSNYSSLSSLVFNDVIDANQLMNSSEVLRSHRVKLKNLWSAKHAQHVLNLKKNDSTLFDLRSNIRSEMDKLKSLLSFLQDSTATLYTTNLYKQSESEFMNASTVFPIFNPSILALTYKEKHLVDPSGHLSPKYIVCFRYTMDGDEVYNTVDLIGFYLLSPTLEIISFASPPVFLMQQAYDGTRDFIRGEDPRLFRFNDDMYVASNYVNRKISNKRIMRIVRVHLIAPNFKLRSPQVQNHYPNSPSSQLSLSSSKVQFYVNSEGPIISLILSLNQSDTTQEKNWVPLPTNLLEFKKDDLLFIRSYSPLHIAMVNLKSLNNIVTGFSPSGLSLFVDFPMEPMQNKFELGKIWKFGTIRGGSPMISLNSTHSVAAFHSSTILQPTGIRSYFMGLIVLQMRTFPYYISGISRRPIIAKGMYEGTWVHTELEYVIYPGSVAIEGEELVIAYGRNDFEGWVGRFDLNRLMADVESVQY